MDIRVIIPARNEEANLRACLESLTSQTGVSFEIVVVDDASTDGTRDVALRFTGIRLISAEPLPRDGAGEGWTGKNNALVTGAHGAHAHWLLFTDADTVHMPGSLRRSLDEANRERADLLSYSPAQDVRTFSERAVMPVIFAELAAQYPPEKVRDPESGIVAANGQYIFVRREAYEAVGGHATIAQEILEDVVLARQFRNAGYRIYFRYGPDAVRTRMYRNWAQLREGWTKNLALLFSAPARLALQIFLFWMAAWSTIGISVAGLQTRHLPWVCAAAVWVLVYWRIHNAHFAVLNNIMAVAFGMPLVSYLLLRSKLAHASGKVSWKGRSYDVKRSGGGSIASVALAPKY